MNKNKKFLYEVEFTYFKGDEPEEMRFTEGFYETEKSLEAIIDFTERNFIRLGHKLLSAKITKQS